MLSGSRARSGADLASVLASPELAAQRALAASVHADFTREACEFAAGGRVPDWLAWSHRLAWSLCGLLDALDGPTGGGADT
jgi:hypothetical protein